MGKKKTWLVDRLEQHTWRVAAELAPRVLGLAVGALVEAAGADRDDLHERVASHLGKLQRRPAQLATLSSFTAQKAHRVSCTQINSNVTKQLKFTSFKNVVSIQVASICLQRR